MNSKKLLTALLVAAMVTIPVRADDPPPEKDMWLMGCAVIAIGVVVIIGMRYLCKNLPDPGTCPCGCKLTTCGCTESSGLAPLVPPTGEIVTNPPAASVASAKLDYDGSAPYPAGSMIDGQGNSWNYNNAFSFSLQTSVDLRNWTYALTIHGWTIGAGVLICVRSNGVTVTNAYFTQALNPNNGLPLDLPGGPQRFYRIACQ